MYDDDNDGGMRWFAEVGQYEQEQQFQPHHNKEPAMKFEKSMQFEKATRKKSKLRLALTGPSGSGKTYGALNIAAGLGGKIAVIDTERGSASLYSHIVEFDVLELDPPYTPERFIEAVRAAERAGYDVLIIDSITHEWSGVGGCIELVDEVARAKYKGNSWSAWSDITPRHRAFIDTLMRSPLHIVATARSKTETAQIEEHGRKKVIKLGMKAEQREGMEYEMSVVLDIVHDGHFAIATKDRTGLFADNDPKPITIDTGRQLLDWLESGEDPKPLPVQHAGMDESAIIDHLIAINDATTLGELKTAYSTAFRAGNAADDVVALGRFDLAKESRKAALSEPAA